LPQDADGMTLGTLQTLLQMIAEKQRLVRLLNEYIDGPGLTIVIGAEHPNPGLRPFSLIASTYDDGSGIGTVGVIGPTRMRYSRAIAAVDDAARARDGTLDQAVPLRYRKDVGGPLVIYHTKANDGCHLVHER